MTYYVKSESPIEPVTAEAVPPPLVIWGPGDPRPTLPIAGWTPGTGTWPIPPEQVGKPDGIWGPNDPRPTVPIAEPPWGWGNKPPALPEVDLPNAELVYGWTPDQGWYVVVVGVPQGPVPTPSKRR